MLSYQPFLTDDYLWTLLLWKLKRYFLCHIRIFQSWSRHFGHLFLWYFTLPFIAKKNHTYTHSSWFVLIVAKIFWHTVESKRSLGSDTVVSRQNRYRKYILGMSRPCFLLLKQLNGLKIARFIKNKHWSNEGYKPLFVSTPVLLLVLNL